MMSCEELTKKVTDYLEGRFTLWERVSIQMHLGICRGCRAYLTQMKQTLEVVGKLPDAEDAPEVHDEVMERFRKWAEKRP